MLFLELYALSLCDVVNIKVPDTTTPYILTDFCMPSTFLQLKDVSFEINLSQFSEFTGLIHADSLQINLQNVSFSFLGRIEQSSKFYALTNGQLLLSQFNNVTFRFMSTIISPSINLIANIIQSSENWSNITIQGSLIATCSQVLPFLSLSNQILNLSVSQIATRLNLQTNCVYYPFSPTIYQSKFINIAAYDQIQILSGGSVNLILPDVDQMVNLQTITTQVVTSYSLSQTGSVTSYFQNLSTEGKVIINSDPNIKLLSIADLSSQTWIAPSLQQIQNGIYFYMENGNVNPVYLYRSALYSNILNVNQNMQTLCDPCISSKSCSLTQSVSEPNWSNFELIRVTTFICACSKGLTGSVCNIKATLSAPTIALIVIVILLAIALIILVVFYILLLKRKSSNTENGNNNYYSNNEKQAQSKIKQHRSITPASVIGAPSILDDQRVSNASGSVTPGQYRPSVDPPKSIQIKAPSQQKTIQDTTSPFSVTGYRDKQWKSGIEANDPSTNDSRDSQLVDDEAPAVNLKEI